MGWAAVESDRVPPRQCDSLIGPHSARFLVVAPAAQQSNTRCFVFACFCERRVKVLVLRDRQSAGDAPEPALLANRTTNLGRNPIRQAVFVYSVAHVVTAP